MHQYIKATQKTLTHICVCIYIQFIYVCVYLYMYMYVCAHVHVCALLVCSAPEDLKQAFKSP